MPLELPEDLRTNLVICGLSGKRYTGVRELHEILKPLVLPGQVTMVARDGLCSLEAVNRYVKWARATFFIRVEAPDAVRYAKGWRAEFGPEDFVRDDHWTETALDDWDGWDAVVYHDGDEETLLAHANELAPRINALAKSPELSKHTPIPDALMKKTEHTSALPECMVPGWGVNPPKKNVQGEYEAQPTIIAAPAGGSGAAPAGRSGGPGDAQKPNLALEAATARAATAATRWDVERGESDRRDSLDASGIAQDLGLQQGVGAVRSSSRGSNAGSRWYSGDTGGPGGGGWGCGVWEASTGPRQRSSSRGRWEDGGGDGSSSWSWGRAGGTDTSAPREPCTTSHGAPAWGETGATSGGSWWSGGGGSGWSSGSWGSRSY